MFDDTAPDSVELSVVLPCLNEAETLAICVQKAVKCLADLGVLQAQIAAVSDGRPTRRKRSWKRGLSRKPSMLGSV